VQRLLAAGCPARLADAVAHDGRMTAYKFALYEAAANVRKRVWQGREIPLDAGTWPLLPDDHTRPLQQGAETAELLAAVRQGIEQDLSAHQREVLVAIVLNDVPIDVLAERLNMTRGALYKTVHDARQKLRAALTLAGSSPKSDGARRERTAGTGWGQPPARTADRSVRSRAELRGVL
jgi:RNA polymerase sigma-70 factor (ECF subfamily)